jgi:hypothetical protein
VVEVIADIAAIVALALLALGIKAVGLYEARALMSRDDEWETISTQWERWHRTQRVGYALRWLLTIGIAALATFLIGDLGTEWW